MWLATYHLRADWHARKQRVRGKGEWVVPRLFNHMDVKGAVNCRKCFTCTSLSNNFTSSSGETVPRCCSTWLMQSLQRNAIANRWSWELRRHSLHITCRSRFWLRRTMSKSSFVKACNCDAFFFMVSNVRACDSVFSVLSASTDSGPELSDEDASSESSSPNITALLRPHSG